jgi:Xaa-Pro dipeptidase
MAYQKLFAKHIEVRRKTIDDILDHTGIDILVIDAGNEDYFYEDDQTLPYRPNAQFAHWCPIETHGHMLLLERGKKPKLYYFQPDDFWEEHAELGNPWWANEFDITIVKNRD